LRKIFTERKGGGSGRRAGSLPAVLLWRERERRVERIRKEEERLQSNQYK
jgi:hypothetical protein